MSRHSAKRPAPPDAQEVAWVADEDRFVLQQAKTKSIIRVKAGRATAIDLLTVTWAVLDPARDPQDDDDGLEDIELVEPESVFEGVSRDELEELKRGVDGYLALERGKAGKEFWGTMKTICQDRLTQIDTQSDKPHARGVGSVASDLDKLLGPKSLEELEKLEGQIRKKLGSGEPLDTDYWEHLLSSLGTYKARARLAAVGRRIVGSRVAGLRKLQIEEARGLRARLDESLESREARGQEQGDEKEAEGRHALDPEPLLRLRPEDKALASLTETDFAAQLAQDRHRVLKQGYVPTTRKRPSGTSLQVSNKRQRTATTDDQPLSETSAFDREVARGLRDNEAIFTTEVALPVPMPAGLRKPRYFARVVTGYEWNKYNQTHYDHDNPPPKVVQGYKFHVFYPDLPAANVTAPTYQITREEGRRRGEVRAAAGEEDTCVLRFVSPGVPYGDVAFRVVDREWDFSAKRERGFRSRFEGGVLGLWFQFKKIYYRK
ncbi:hypothetical protein LTR08_003933 [Meristemomyces frigidus]|nr:hypothetical protein LTR08_003933 [Meristemomyces frigidus]